MPLGQFALKIHRAIARSHFGAHCDPQPWWPGAGDHLRENGAG
ncbi:hypothetical protein [Streptomyces gilvosporeus]|nr:hypothetical protein [Streptomyces gilvosporeus]